MAKKELKTFALLISISNLLSGWQNLVQADDPVFIRGVYFRGTKA